MRSLLSLGGLLLAVVAGTPVHAQTPAAVAGGLTLIVDTTRREVEPGSTMTLRVIVVNREGSDRDFLLKTSLPENWRLLSIPTQARVVGKERLIRLVQVVVPANAGAGEYQITHSLRAAGLAEDLEARSTIAVRARRSLTVTLLEEPYFAASGSTYRATFIVTNRGNVATRIHLHAKAERDVSTKIDTLSELKPGESRRVGVVVSAGAADGTSEARHHVALLAEAEGGLSGDGKAIPEAVASVRVIPRSDGGGLPLFSLPATLSLTSTQTQRSGTVPGSQAHSFELSGAGAVTEGSGSLLDFFARGPRPDKSVFGQRDEYRIGLTGANYGLRAGDQIFSLTPLSDGGTVAMGLSGHFRRGLWSGGGYANRDRTMSGGRSERAAFVGYDPVSRLHLSANLLQRSEIETSSVATLYARFNPTTRTVVEAERGTEVQGIGAGSTATLIRAAGDQGWIAFDVKHQEADSAYAADSHGTTQNVGSITFRPATRLRLSARLSDETRPLFGGLISPTLLSSGQRSTKTAELALDAAGFFAAGLRTFSEKTSGLAPDALGLGANELSGWARTALHVRWFSVAGTTERGLSDDGLGGPRHPFASNSVQAAIRVGSHQTYALFAEQSTGQRRYATTPQNVVSLGGSAQWQIGPLSLAVTGSGSPTGSLTQPSDSIAIGQTVAGWLDGAAMYSFSEGRSLSVRLHSVSTGMSRPATTTARIAYSMPIKLPIGRSRTAGRVMGRVYDAETGAGIANALVRVGDHSALTDDQGRVAFGSMRPDRYPVFVDLGARQSGALGFDDDALQVAARAGETTQIGVRVSRTARLSGTLQLFEGPSGAAMISGDSARPRKSHGLGGIVIALMNGSEERRIVTDGEGRFELRDARAGMWRVVVPASQLPALTYVQGDSVRVVDLAPGVSQDVQIDVLPRQRKILPLDAAPTAPVGPPTLVVPPAVRTAPVVPPIVPPVAAVAPTATEPVAAPVHVTHEKTLIVARKAVRRATRAVAATESRAPRTLDCPVRNVFQGFTHTVQECAPAKRASLAIPPIVQVFVLR